MSQNTLQTKLKRIQNEILNGDRILIAKASKARGLNNGAGYSVYTVRSVLGGRRNNDEILGLAIELVNNRNEFLTATNNQTHGI